MHCYFRHFLVVLSEFVALWGFADFEAERLEWLLVS